MYRGFPDSSVGKESTCNGGDPSLISGSGRSAGEGIGYPLQYSWASLVAQLIKKLPAMRETWVRSLGSIPGLGRFPWKRERLPTPVFLGFPSGSAGKESACDVEDLGSIPGLGRFPWKRERLPTPVFWPGEFHGLYSPWGHRDLDMTERLALSLCIKYHARSRPSSLLGRPTINQQR